MIRIFDGTNKQAEWNKRELQRTVLEISVSWPKSTAGSTQIKKTENKSHKGSLNEFEKNI